ncbi:hypothetical protein [Bacillus haynesii]|uniref:hypothetical protein n=1 Tax=Bacillus haynesii TaxID=1925021 RepID=UPI002DBABCB4|nr:hypothetical protein [Bacillus haynesii]
MVIISVDKVPADNKVIIFRLFIIFVGLTTSPDTAIHITTENIATMVTTDVDILDSSLDLHDI